MPFCINCGRWVEEGDTCGFCGGGGSYNFESDDVPSSDHGSYSRPFKKELTSKDIRRIRQSNPYWDTVTNNKVFRKLNECDNGDIYLTFDELDRAISRAERNRHYRFRSIGLDSEIGRNPYEDILVKFTKRGKYVDIFIEMMYCGGEVFDGGNYKFGDGRLMGIPEFKRLIQKVKSEGFEYNGINFSYSQKQYTTEIETDDFVVLEFEKGGFFFKYYKFNIPDRTYEPYREQCDVWRIFDKGDSPEMKRLSEEIGRIERSLGCKYEKHAHMGQYLLFKTANGKKIICRYDGQNERLEKVIECTMREFDSDSFDSPKMKYNFNEPVYWDDGLP